MEEKNKDGNQETPVKKNGFPVWLIGIVAVLALIYLPSMLTGSKKVQGKTTNQLAVTESQPVTVVSIEAGSFYYKPNEIRVKRGERVRLEFKSQDQMHDFNVDELGIKSPIVKSGDIALVDFSADKTGEFEFYCSVDQHRKLGQVGKLIVE